MRNRLRIIAGIIAVIVVSSCLSGCGGGIMGTALRIVRAAAILPDSWTSDGGIVTILADIAGGSVREVVAIIHKIGDIHSTAVKLTRNADGHYEATYRADGNTTPTTPETYAVTVTAADDTGNTATASDVGFEVPPTQP